MPGTHLITPGSLFLSTLATPEWAVVPAAIRCCAAGFSTAIVFALVCLSIRQRSLKWVPIYGTIFILHPVFWFGLEEMLGDPERFVWVAVSLVLASILVLNLFWPEIGRRRFILSLCVISWIALLLASLTAALDLAQIDGGIVSQSVSALAFSERRLSTIALALTLLSVLQGPANRLWLAYVVGVKSFKKNERHHDSEPSNAGQNKTRLRIVFGILLVTLVCYLPITFKLSIKSGDHYALVSIFGAAGWIIVLLVATMRGEFPGWKATEGRGGRVRCLRGYQLILVARHKCRIFADDANRRGQSVNRGN